MMSIEVLKERFNSFHHMYSQEARLQSFVDWPFREECLCTPEKVRNAFKMHLNRVVYEQ